MNQNFENINKEIGQRIRQRREELHMTQEELATKLGYKSKSTINKIESGINSITQNKLKALAEALDTTELYLLNIRTTPENSVHKRKQNEQKILEKIKQRNNAIKEVLYICESNEPTEYEWEDPESGEVITKVQLPEDLAKNYIFRKLKDLSLNELLEVYKLFLDKEIYKLSEKLTF